MEKGRFVRCWNRFCAASGFKTGLYTSPHLVDFSERFRLNGAQISASQLDQYIQQMETLADEVEANSGLRGATFFEISTAIAFQYFADEQVDIAIIETGMGGRWDATNVVIPLISVITHIDVDHTNFLGNSVEQIAAEKAGIIKPGRPVVSAAQSEAVSAVLEKAGEPILCSTEAVSVQKTGHPQKLKMETHSRSLPPIQLPLLGEHQRENCAVAVAALETLSAMLDFEPSFKKGLESVEWAARFQRIQSDPPIILDGAHNPSAARALLKALKENYSGYQVGFIFGFLEDKDAVEFLRILKPLATQVWTIPIDAPRGTTAEQAAVQVQAAGMKAIPSTVTEAQRAANQWAAEYEKRVIVIAGSLYLKQMLIQGKND